MYLLDSDWDATRLIKKAPCVFYARAQVLDQSELEEGLRLLRGFLRYQDQSNKKLNSKENLRQVCIEKDTGRVSKDNRPIILGFDQQYQSEK